jgi:putative tryptophan/tyrosine transport system substrate-binding protein
MAGWLLRLKKIRRFSKNPTANSLKQLDGVDKSIEKKGRHNTGLLTAVLAVCMAFAGGAAVLKAAPALRVAIFDFDKREVSPDPLARHIEHQLRKRFNAIEVVHYSGLGDEGHSVELLRSIEADGYDLVITRTSDALIIALHTLFKTPTLYTNVTNPLLLGFKTIGPPGGNISGVSYYIPIEKHLRIYKAIFPAMKKPGFIFDTRNKSRKVEVPETRNACTALGLNFEIEFVDRPEQLSKAANALIERGADAIVCASSGTVYENIRLFLDDANRCGVPIFSFYKMGVPEGAVAALSSDYFRMADELLLPMAVKVLEDKVSPGSLPAAFFDKNSLFVNREQAQRFDITIPPEIEKQNDVIYLGPAQK